MPTISTFFGVVIQMFWTEHGPPHFHAIYAKHEAIIDIRELRVTRGALPRRALARVLARIIHDDSWRNRAVARRDGQAKPRRTKAYLKQYVEGLSGEHARRQALSQRRIRDCSRSVHE